MPTDTAIPLQLLDRSDELYEEIAQRLNAAQFDTSDRGQVVCGMCFVSFEHGDSIRLLVGAGKPTSIVGLMRMQFEALVRAMWALWVAPEQAIDKVMAPLSMESEAAARDLPSVAQMLKELGRQAGKTMPQGALTMLEGFKNASWGTMNSFVHGGIHPLRRVQQGYPVPLVRQIVRNSNALATMAGMTLALITGDKKVAGLMSKIQRDFSDCLPELLTR